MSIRHSAIIVLLFGLCFLLLTIGGFYRTFPHSESDGALAEQLARHVVEQHQNSTFTAEEQEEFANAGEYHKRLLTCVDYPGISLTSFENLHHVHLEDSTPIIGIQFDGEEVALVVEKMTDPKAHIVNLNFHGKKSISVTYCYLLDCARVVSEDSKVPIPLHVGGIDIDQQMVLLFNGKRYSQTSPDLPLTDYPFQRMSLGTWKRLYPNTHVFVPPSRISIDHRVLADG